MEYGARKAVLYLFCLIFLLCFIFFSHFYAVEGANRKVDTEHICTIPPYLLHIDLTQYKRNFLRVISVVSPCHLRVISVSSP